MNKQRIFKEIKEWTEALFVAIVLAFFIRTFFIQAFKIPTGSMKPTLLEGDHILVSKILYGAKIPFTKNTRVPGIREPKRGDIIVFVYPEDPKKDYIKRLVGFPGETVRIKDGRVYINEKPLLDKEFQNRYYYNRGEFCTNELESLKIPDNSFFVLGDNSGSSVDSRYWGFVPKENIIGKSVLIYWPLWRIRLTE